MRDAELIGIGMDFVSSAPGERRFSLQELPLFTMLSPWPNLAESLAKCPGVRVEAEAQVLRRQGKAEAYGYKCTREVRGTVSSTTDVSYLSEQGYLEQFEMP